MRRRVLGIVAAVVAAFGTVAMLPSAAVHAATPNQYVYFEKVAPEDVVFVPACVPGPQDPTCDPRGAGSWFASVADLTRVRGGAAVGVVTVFCLTTRKVGADYYGHCTEVLHTPEGTFEASGEINESALERFVPQQMPLVSGGPGVLTVQQVTYPDEFVLTVSLS